RPDALPRPRPIGQQAVQAPRQRGTGRSLHGARLWSRQATGHDAARARRPRRSASRVEQLSSLFPRLAQETFREIEPFLVSANSRCRPWTTCSSASSCAVISADGVSGRVARIRAILTAAKATMATIGMSGVRSMASLFPQEVVLTKEGTHLTRRVDAEVGW